MHHLSPYMTEAVEFHHIIDKYAPGEKDEDWVPKLAVEGNWLVFTADAGKNSKDGFKLPDLCAENNLVHILLSGKLHQMTMFDKINWIGLGWPLVEKQVYCSAPGSRFQMRLVSSKGGLALTIGLNQVEIQSMADRQIASLAKRELHKAKTKTTLAATTTQS